MITDKETNFVYISDLLESQCPAVFNQLIHWFNKLEIQHAVLSNTKDLWVVDFMPIQIAGHNFVQFKYDPDYLRSEKYKHIRTDTKDILNEIGIAPRKSDIVLDGGNIIKARNKAIATSKIFNENPNYLEDDLITEIKSNLQIEQLIVIPQEPGDFVGHADGMVRFVNENSVLVNQYPKNKTYDQFSINLRSSLRNAGLHCIEFPYTSWQNEDVNSASGCYINFLEIGNCIFYPVFNSDDDKSALSILKDNFSERELIGIECTELAKFGGVLNCATWNIQK